MPPGFSTGYQSRYLKTLGWVHIQSFFSLPIRRMTRLTGQSSISDLVKQFCPNLQPYKEKYKYFHSHPELPTQESHTAEAVSKHLTEVGYYVRKNIGGHGVAGVLKNGDGPTVLLRAEMDALPIEENTSLPYASKVRMRDTDGVEKPVSHACGHDMHITCLMAAAELLYKARSQWKGQLVLVFQPNEERGGGARAMMRDRLYKDESVPQPDVVLGQYMVNIRSGFVATRKGYALAGKAVFKVTILGRGGHGSAPQGCIDPVVIAAYIIIRLQSIVSREIDPNKMVVITCGSIHSGDAPNTIPDKALLKVDVRAYSSDVLDKAVSAIRRIVEAECQASGVTEKPQVEQIEDVPPVIWDDATVASIAKEFKQHFGKDCMESMALDTAADGFPILAPEGVPYAYWNFGSEDHGKWENARDEGRLNELPSNHSPKYAPIIEPTLKVGTHALAVAALTFLTEKNPYPESNELDPTSLVSASI
jgi:amidohydrolase